MVSVLATHWSHSPPWQSPPEFCQEWNARACDSLAGLLKDAPVYEARPDSRYQDLNDRVQYIALSNRGRARLGTPRSIPDRQTKSDDSTLSSIGSRLWNGEIPWPWNSSTPQTVSKAAAADLDAGDWRFVGYSSRTGSLFAERDSEGTGHPQNPSLDTMSELEDLGAILDPADHLATLNTVIQEISEHIYSSALLESSKGVVRARYTESKDEIQQALRSVVTAIRLMKQAGVCNGTISALVESTTRKDTAEVIEFSEDEICSLLSLLESHQPDIGRILTAKREREENVPAYIKAQLPSQPARLLHLIPPGCHKEWTWPFICLFCSFLALATASFAESHVTRDAQSQPVSFDALVQRDPQFIEEHYCFRRRRLTCLDNFVNDPVWVFGAHEEPENKLDLSININQFASLWGPVFALPAEADFQSLVALHVDGGFLYRARDTEKLVPGEVAVHFAASGQIRRSRAASREMGGKWVMRADHEALPDALESFSANARLLIGRPDMIDATAPVRRVSQDGLGIASTAFLVNATRHLDMSEFAEHHASHLVDLGVKAERYIPDATQVSMSTGKWVNVGISRTYKLDKGKTHKDRVVELYNRSPRKIPDILGVRIGLELSLHTYNARRTTLRDALLLAFPDANDILAEAISTQDYSQLVQYLNDLSETGLNEDDTLVVYWPNATGLPMGFRLTKARPSWHKILKDTVSSSCFAVASSQCLEYTALDAIKGHQVVTSTAVPALQTYVQVHSDSQVTTPLQPGAIMMLSSGHIELRNEQHEHQLAYFRDKSPINRGIGAWRRFTVGSPKHVHQELVDAAKRSRYTVPVCIVDAPSGFY